MGTLFVVATPIGNLEDLTYRAARTLSEVDLIAAEDTRQTKILLRKYNIQTPLTSYHKFNIREKTDQLVAQLKAGSNLALVSDSGTPGISDPGAELIRAAGEQGIRVEPIPGPTAAIAALAVSGLSTEEFTFVGFLPKKPGRKARKIKELTDSPRTIIIYESPFRLLKTLQAIGEIDGERQVAVCRELTKKFEEIIRGPVSEVIAKLKERRIKGEIVLVISGQGSQRERN